MTTKKKQDKELMKHCASRLRSVSNSLSDAALALEVVGLDRLASVLKYEAGRVYEVECYIEP